MKKCQMINNLKRKSIIPLIHTFLSKTTSVISQEKMKFNAVVASGISEATWGNIDGTKRLCLTNCSSETHKK